VQYIDFEPILKKELFCLENIPEGGMLNKDSFHITVFYKTDAIDIDGIF
jgi:hypothetical protein